MDWFSLPKLAEFGLKGLPVQRQSLHRLAMRENWQRQDNKARLVKGATKPVWEYHISLLPAQAQAQLRAMTIKEAAGVNAGREAENPAKVNTKALWQRFEGLSEKQQKACEARLKALLLAETLQAGGVIVGEAMRHAAEQSGCSLSSIYNWRGLVQGYERPDWLPALAANYSSNADDDNAAAAACPAPAWEALMSDYLRPSKPAFSACYRRVKAAAKEHGWGELPSERSLRRRMDNEVGKSVLTLARAGRDMAKTLYPPQRRDRSALHAMEAVNMDGHKLDVFVKVPWKEEPVRLFLIATQDLFSGKILSWRLAEAETWETVRLVIGDMIEHYGIPERITLDNGRAFASKWISGGAKSRFRFKIKEEEPQGLLTTFGIQTQWTTPYSGQSKPIERTWRDLAEAISKHPLCAGAYTGANPNAKPEDYGTRAIPMVELAAHVDAQIAACNAQEGRKAANCAGRSFDQTFEASLAADNTIIRHATESQRALWLLAAENVRARKGSGEIHFNGNRYWAAALNQYAGQKVTLRFDPDTLHSPVRVYDLENRLICVADCIEDAGFYDMDAARRHNSARKAYLKAQTAQKQAVATLAPDKLAEIYARAEQAQAKEEKRPVRGKITRLATPARQAAAKPAPAPAAPAGSAEMSNADFEDAFIRATQALKVG
ncbi:transposase domain-containing protein [Candidatus Tokpelaia sp.]|uniref:transposase domain-containing protein n=1 Tax=Candidatus Tokpelaia sp. TaxID=2233777 RepID=UPI0012385BD5|nr:transposase domain-containing protein [Candidatus Tokpelaia sp.]KAA6405056.1 transposase [Candidatus Tokpelaia sp.]